MAYTGMQRSLIQEAERYVKLGYKIGFANGKALVGTFEKNANQTFTSWNAISIILDGIVCVDFDTTLFNLGVEHPLPPTMKEKSPRGMHLFYRMPANMGVWEPKIKWKPDIDLLVNGPANNDVWGSRKQSVRYGATVSAPASNWGGHVLVSPSPGYTRMYPTVTPSRDKLTMAPDWIIDELQR